MLGLILCLTVLSGPAASSQAKGELIERTLAIVGGQVITLSDVQTAVALGLIEPSGQGDPTISGTALLIDRMLVLREVQRYAPPEPTDVQIDERLELLRGRFSNGARFKQLLEIGGFTEPRLRSWIRDDLRIAAYLNQRFAAVSAPGDAEVAAYYDSHREEFDRTAMTFEAAAAIIRERLFAERRAELIADWIADLRRRTVVVELWKEKN
jgi:hypothetical protein